MPRSEEADPKSSRETYKSPKMDAVKTSASPSEAPIANSTTATTKGSRRAQGWHLAVGGGAPPGTAGSNHSALDGKALRSSGANNTTSLKSSVQFSKETLDSRGSPLASKGVHGAAHDEAANFRQNMADFLTVMYGNKTASGVVGKGEKGGAPDATEEALTAQLGTPGALLKAGRRPVLPGRSTGGVSPGSKGPLVKGLTASSQYHSKGDHIDTLVESLVCAYSRLTTSAVGEFQGTTGPDDDNPITYSGSRQSSCFRAQGSTQVSRGNAVSTGSGKNNEVSEFVCQAMGNIFTPGGIRGQGTVSSRSILSSLRLDKNLFNLMPFPTHSNLGNVTRDEDSGTLLEPVHVGTQAMFRSVGMRPDMNSISVSKSMRGVIPPVPSDSGKGSHLSTTQTPLSGDSGGPRGSSRGSLPLSQRQGLGKFKQRLDSDEVMTKSRANQRDGSGAGGNGNIRTHALSMSLDSKALGKAGGADDGEDSWGDEPADMLTTKVMEGGGPAMVLSARSLLDYCKTRTNATLQKALEAMQDEEQLKRDVVIAVEDQLFVFIRSLERSERPKEGGRSAGGSDQRKGSGGKSSNCIPAAKSEKLGSGDSGTGVNASCRDTVSSGPAPFTGNTQDFLEESPAGANRSKSLRSPSLQV
ncbi:hypothetical protein, conserved [Leishmania tarentolae]|uniref:Uncharacterized protein n=1 Tax=Leishmania tarentolae TaxID=5689 RepID=A0A640KP72_LEITA|nr:hypothetical protein, conserved [Leishmania tarentolae]